MSRIMESMNKPLSVKSHKELSGPFAVLGVFNQNGRRYPEQVYEEAYSELIPKIQEKRLMGELDHPLNYDEVRLSNVSHLIKECYIRESNGKKTVYGTVELLDTPAGKIAQALVAAGIPLGISSRAVGNTKQLSEGVDVIQLKLITYDLVAEPSFKTAILSETKKSQLSESLNLIESKLPLNESEGEHADIRNRISNIRESLCLNETNHSQENLTYSKDNLQTLEIDTLKSLLESKKSVIKADTELLKESRKTIKALKSTVGDLESRYEKLLGNHQKLQESYNDHLKSQKLQESKVISELNETILDLRKRLAVEMRGMSYDRVQHLLEGVTNESEISAKLDSISNLSKRSNQVSLTSVEKIAESVNVDTSRSVLSSIISKV